jgi:hypothetical protein
LVHLFTCSRRLLNSRSLVLDGMFCKSLLVLFLLAIVLAVLLQCTDSGYPFGIFKLFLNNLAFQSFDYEHSLFQKQVVCTTLRRVWRYQRGNQNPYIEEEQTTQWPKEKVQKAKQRSTKHTYKTKDRVTRIPLKTGGELRCSGRVSSFCSTSDTRRINLVTNPVISHEWYHRLYLYLYKGVK